MRRAKKEPKKVREWFEAWDNRVKGSFLQLNPTDYDTSIKLCATLLLIPEKYRNHLFNVFCLLLLGPKRKKHWAETVDALPKDKEKLVNLTKCLTYYQKLANKGKFEPLNKSYIRPQDIVKNVVIIGESWKTYLNLYEDHYFTYPAIIFGDKGIKEASGKMRGKFGTFSEQKSEYAEEVEDSVEVHDV